MDLCPLTDLWDTLYTQDARSSNETAISSKNTAAATSGATARQGGIAIFYHSHFRTVFQRPDYSNVRDTCHVTRTWHVRGGVRCKRKQCSTVNNVKRPLWRQQKGMQDSFLNYRVISSKAPFSACTGSRTLKSTWEIREKSTRQENQPLKVHIAYLLP
jgi:hypothetical protein